MRKPNYYPYNRSKNSLSGTIGLILFAIVAMPAVGIYLTITGKTSENRILGGFLTVFGIFLYLILGII